MIAGDDEPRITHAIERDRPSVRPIELLERHYNLVCLDTGSRGARARHARAFSTRPTRSCVVSATGLDGARAASSTLDWLEEHGHADLVRDAVPR